ncbi:hypothetical protein GCM10017600_55430 [Streptosporangium carneum]|uniref:DUF1707 domain-containing protein n=1 Tax=Streptosporangium carneum TaxID=47481 RepID=A0A9W6I4W2_9ACTN|nr:hypothetical protein GCM10017600_55430 [Streptosporangium carneum]
MVEHVKAAYADGRLDKIDFDDRLERAMTARVHADLMPIMHELYGHRPPMPAPYPFSEGVSASSRHCARADAGGERLGAAAAHLLPLTGLLAIGPLIMLLTAGKTSPYVRRHAVEALNFQLTLLGATVLLAITFVGVVLMPVLWLGAMALSVVGGVAALGEGDFRYPFTLRPVK